MEPSKVQYLIINALDTLDLLERQFIVEIMEIGTSRHLVIYCRSL